MKIIIEHYKVKRELNGDGFNICGSLEDLRAIARQIEEQTRNEFTFGWVSIRDEGQDPHIQPSTSPLPWAKH